MDFKNYLQKTAVNIETVMAEYFKLWEEEGNKVSPKLLHLIKAANDASDGGKRLRGVLVCLGYELAGGEKNNEILKPAAAFEIFQTAILAHDDIIDKSSLRRGKPTIYNALGENHYALSQTICLGDIGFFQATKILADSDFPDNLIVKAISSFTKTMLETALGEMLDVEIPYLGKDRTEEDALKIFKYKTARYTLVGPLQLGVILGSADESLLENIEKFGESLGIAFQIQDDILGVFGTEKEIGKSISSDIEEGKLTLLISFAKENADPEQLKILEDLYGKTGLSEEELEKVREIFVSCGALEYSRNKAVKYVLKAKKYITEITTDKNMQNLLEEMSDFLVERSK